MRRGTENGAMSGVRQNLACMYIISVIGRLADFDEVPFLALSVQAVDDDEHAVRCPYFEHGRYLRPVRLGHGVQSHGFCDWVAHLVLRLRALAPAAGGNRGLRLPQVGCGHAFK